jgi:hypothetical protein
VRRYQLFAAAAAVAVLCGAGPALAAPGNGKANGHNKQAEAPKPKPEKTKGLRVNGGGTAGGAEFSVQARSDHPKKAQKGHFNYTKAAPGAPAEAPPEVKVRCKSVTVAAATAQPGDTGAATVTGNCREGNGKAATPMQVRATFYDNPAGDRADIVFIRNGVESPVYSGPIEGSIHVR